MTDPTNDNDINALLRYLKSGHTPHWYDDSTRWHAALTALVAERDALRKRVAELEMARNAWQLEAQLESQNAKSFWRERAERRDAEQRSAADRDLRERLVCAALNGILSEQRGLLNHEYALRAIGLADATLAAMRKGEA